MPLVQKTLAEKTAEAIREMIVQEGIAPAKKLPAELTLAKRFGVSRGTIREAENILSSLNVVDLRLGKGCFVSQKNYIGRDPLGFNTISDRVRLTKDLMKVRFALEPFTSRLAAEHATGEEVALLWENLARQEQEDYESKAFERLDLQFHIIISDASHNLAIRQVTPIIEEAFVALAENRQNMLGFEKTLATHRAVIEAIERHDGIAAADNMLFHLKMVEKSTFVSAQNQFDITGTGR